MLRLYRGSDVELGPWPPSGVNENVELDGSELTGSIIHRWPGNQRVCGIMRLTPGRIRGRFRADDNGVILAGRMTIVAEGGEPIECQAGDVFIVESGTAVEFIVHETVLRVTNAFIEEGMTF